MDPEQLKAYLDEKFAQIMRKSGTNRKAPKVTLIAKGNQKQYDHQSDVLEALEEIKLLVVEGEQDRAEEVTAKAIEMVKKRMKLIRMADRSDHGWFTVDAYESDDLASNSEDEMKIRRAEAEAARKRKKFQQRVEAERPIVASCNDSQATSSGSEVDMRRRLL